MKPLYFFLAAFLLLAACKKEPDTGPTSAEGTVLDATTQQPVPFATVALARKPADILTTIGFSQIQGVQAGADGRFSLSFDASEEYNYFLFGLAPRYLYPVEPLMLKRGRKNTVNVPIRPEAYVRLHIKNVNPFNQWDEFVLTRPNDLPITLIGASIDTTLIVRGRGNEENSIGWVKSKNSVQLYTTEVIFLPAHDTTDFQINY